VIDFYKLCVFEGESFLWKKTFFNITIASVNIVNLSGNDEEESQGRSASYWGDVIVVKADRRRQTMTGVN
jgi:hypothetical protein